MPDFKHIIGQALAYAAIAVFIGVLATFPVYQPIPDDHALLKLSFTHAGQLVGECREMGAEEMAKLPPNMRRPRECPRERHPVYVELMMDGQPLLQRQLKPTGIWGDGAAVLYSRFSVPAGRHDIRMRLRDSGRSEGFDYERGAQIDLVPGQNFVVDFDKEAGGFRLN